MWVESKVPIMPCRDGFTAHIAENVSAHGMPRYPEMPKLDAKAIDVGKMARTHMAGKMILCDDLLERTQPTNIPYHTGLNNMSQKALLPTGVYVYK